MCEAGVIAFVTLEMPQDGSLVSHCEPLALLICSGWVGRDLGPIHHPSGHNAGWASPLALSQLSSALIKPTTQQQSQVCPGMACAGLYTRCVFINFNRPQCLKQCLNFFFLFSVCTEVWHCVANGSVTTMPVNQGPKLRFNYPSIIQLVFKRVYYSNQQ